MTEFSNTEMADSIRADPIFQEIAMRRLLTKRGSGPDGQILENTFCSNWNSSVACLRIASIACPQCNLARYCSRACLQDHQEYHRELCCSHLRCKVSMPHSSKKNLVKDMSESQCDLPTISNPPFPVYGLLRDLAPLVHYSPPTTSTPLSLTTYPSTTRPCLQAPLSMMTSSSTSPPLMTPLSWKDILSTSSPSPALMASPVLACPPVPFALPNHLCFLFPSAYDLRNVLQTACQIPEDYRGHVTFVINSPKGILAVRDLLILELLRCYGSEGIDAAIALWYSSALTNVQSNMFYLAIRRILRSKAHVDNGCDITCYEASFHASSTGSSLRADFGTNATRLLLSMSNEKMCKFEPKEQYWRLEEENRELKEKCAMPAHFASWRRYQTQGLALPFGACDTSFQKPNVLRYSLSLNFIARYSEDALCGWDIPELITSGEKHAASNMDLYGCLFFHVRDMMQTFLCRTKSCRIELRLTQVSPRVLADIMYDTEIKFHRIDGCAFAYDKANPGYRLDLLETVDLLGKLLEKDASPEWPSLLLTSTSDWAGKEISTKEGKLKEPEGKTAPHVDLSTSLEAMVQDGDYGSAVKMLQANLPPTILKRYLNDSYADFFFPYLVNLEVDEEAKKVGLQRQPIHRIVSPSCCLPLLCMSDNTILGAVAPFGKRFYFHVLFSGFSFLDRFLEWGWSPIACLQSPKCELNLVENEAASDARLQSPFGGETSASVEQSEFAETADDADHEWDLSEKIMTRLDMVAAASNQWGSIDQVIVDLIVGGEHATPAVDYSNGAAKDEHMIEITRPNVTVLGSSMIEAPEEDGQSATSLTSDSASERVVAATLAGLISYIESQAHPTTNETFASTSNTPDLGLSGDFDTGEAVADLIKALILSLPLTETLEAHQEDQTSRIVDREETGESQDLQQ